MAVLYRKLTSIEGKLDKLLTQRNTMDIREAPPCFALPLEQTAPPPSPPPSCFAIDALPTEEDMDSTATSQEEYVFRESHLSNIHLRYYGYRLHKKDEARIKALERAFQCDDKKLILNHLYALWTVWQGRTYEDVLRRDICWAEEKYF